MRWSPLTLILLGGRACQPTSVPPADAPPPAQVTPAARSPEAGAQAPQAQTPAPAHETDAAAGHRDGHDHGQLGGHHHEHGKPGYHLDFSEVERFARHFESREREFWQKPAEVVRLLDAQPGQTVADIGAGTGYFLPHLARAVGNQGKVLGLDVEPNMVEYMKRRAQRDGLRNVEARVVRPDDPELAAGSVDRILIVNTWHHIDGRPSYTAKLAKALRPSGWLMIVDFTLESDQGPPKEHRLSAEQVVKELEGGGLRAEVVASETLPKQYVVKGAPR
jgi:SAM-dependent methyltransferase